MKIRRKVYTILLCLALITCGFCTTKVALSQTITDNLFFHGSQIKLVLPEGMPDFTFFEKSPVTITKDIGMWRYYGGLGHFKSKDDPVYDLFVYVHKPVVIALVCREGGQERHWIYDNDKPVRVSEERFIDYMGSLLERGAEV